MKYQKKWLSNLSKDDVVLVSYEYSKIAESDARIFRIGKKYITVQLSEEMAGVAFGNTILFDKYTGKQHGDHKWIMNRRLVRFTESKWEKIKNRRHEIDLCHRISSAVYRRKIPIEDLEEIIEKLEKSPIIPQTDKG